MATVLLVASVAGTEAGERLVCGHGFVKSSETAKGITCIKSQTVKSEMQADRVMKALARRVVCNGEVVDPKSSVGEAGEGLWQVTVRYICAGE